MSGLKATEMMRILTTDGMLFVLVGIVSCVPLMHLAVFTMLDNEDFFLAHIETYYYI